MDRFTEIKLNVYSSCQDIIVGKFMQSFCGQKQKILITDLEQKLILQILSYLSSAQVAECRLLCRKFNKVCKVLLNRRFSYYCKKIPSMLRHLMKDNSLTPSIKEKEINLQMLNAGLLLLRAVFGRYISTGSCCFYPGLILDYIQIVMLKVIFKRRKWVPIHALKTVHKKTVFITTLRKLLRLIETASDHFERKIEPLLPPPRSFIGTKILDLLLSNSEIQTETKIESFFQKVSEKFPKKEITGISVNTWLKQTRADLMQHNFKCVCRSALKSQMKDTVTCQNSQGNNGPQRENYDNNLEPMITLNYILQNINNCNIEGENTENNATLGISNTENLLSANKCNGVCWHSQEMNDLMRTQSEQVQSPNNFKFMREIAENNALLGNSNNDNLFTANKSDAPWYSQLMKDSPATQPEQVKNTELKMNEIKNSNMNVTSENDQESCIRTETLTNEKAQHNTDINMNASSIQSESKIKKILAEVEKSLLQDIHKLARRTNGEKSHCSSSCPYFDLSTEHNFNTSNIFLKHKKQNEPSTSASTNSSIPTLSNFTVDNVHGYSSSKTSIRENYITIGKPSDVRSAENIHENHINRNMFEYQTWPSLENMSLAQLNLNELN